MHIKAIIDHLEDMAYQEQEALRDVAQEVAESSSQDIWDKQLEYHLLQQRIIGIQDTIEEIKAYQAGEKHEN